MFGRPVTLFKLSGFAVRLDARWLIFAVLITWTLAAGLFENFPNIFSEEDALLGLNKPDCLGVKVLASAPEWLLYLLERSDNSDCNPRHLIQVET
jgi:hypothetical protein